MKVVGELIKWIALCVLAAVLLVLVTGIAFPVGLVKSLYKRKVGEGLELLTCYFRRIAISIDQLGNVSGFGMLGWLFVDPEGYAFGNEDETISFVLGENQKKGSLRPLGMHLYRIINWIDPGHFEGLKD